MEILNRSVIYENPLPQLRSRQAAFPNICQLSDGTLLAVQAIGEAFESVDGTCYTCRSVDGGKTWTEPKSTGIHGQASSLCHLEGETLLALHAVRRDTDRPGIYGYVVDFSDRTWDIKEQFLLWEPSVPVFKDNKMAEIFSFLKFGQPIAIKLQDGTLMVSFWYAQEGQYKATCINIKL